MGSKEYKLFTIKLIKKNESAQKLSFWSQNGQKWPLKTAKMSKIFIEYLNFLGHLSTFEAENTTKSRSFDLENNA